MRSQSGVRKGRAGKTAAGRRESRTKASPVVRPTPRRANDVKYPVRRILAERPGAGGRKEYLVDWYPAWEPAAHLANQDQEKEEWETNKAEHTLKLGKITGYRTGNPTEDDSPKQSRLMIDTVLTATKKWFGQPKRSMAKHLFADADWMFGRREDEEDVARLANELGEDSPSAAQVMQETYTEMRGSSEEAARDTKSIYADIQVRFIGQIDPELPNAEPMMRKRGKISSFLKHLSEPILKDMVPQEWKTSADIHAKLKELSKLAHTFVTKSTFLLQPKHIWPLFFVRLFFTSDKLEEILTLTNTMQNPMGDDWHDRTRDVLLYAYVNKFKWEQRPIDCVERTYLQSRESVQWHIEFESVEAEGRGQVAEIVDESDEGEHNADGNDEYEMGEGIFSDGEEMDVEGMKTGQDIGS
jgi:hypothetical protein